MEQQCLGNPKVIPVEVNGSSIVGNVENIL